MKNLKIYCVTNKKINYLEKKNYNFGWVGKEPVPNGYISCRENNDIFDKYSMLGTPNIISPSVPNKL